MMRAVLLKQFGGIENFFIGTYPKPSLRDDSLLVEIKATAINRADILQRQGKYPPPKGESEVLGLEMSGVVCEVGESVTSEWKKGDRVMGLLAGGGYAEYCSIKASHCMKIPSNLTFEEAAALPEVFLTAFQALHWLGVIAEGKSVLIHAAASGVGTAAIQLAKQAGAKTIVVTAGSSSKLDFCVQLGATNCINYHDGPFSSKVLDATNGKGVDILMDFVGAPYWNENLKCLATEGIMTMQGSLGGMTVEAAELGPILSKRLQIKASTLRNRSSEYKSKLINEFWASVGHYFSTGSMKPVISQVLDWQNVAQAHQFVEENKNIGKVVMRIV